MKITGLCLLVSFLLLVTAGYLRFGGHADPRGVSTLALLSVAVSSLGALELKIHRRAQTSGRRIASTLASALRSGALK